MGLLLVITVVLVARKNSSDREVVWLTQAQFNKNTQPGPLASLKESVKQITAPLWRRFRKPHPMIKTHAQIWKLSPATPEPAGLGAPTATNSNGLRAWVLGPAESVALERQFETNIFLSRICGAAVTTLAGQRSTLSSGQAAPQLGASSTGIRLDVISDYSTSAIKMTLHIASTTSGVDFSNTVITRTNLAALCQAIVPADGCVLLNDKNSSGVTNETYWLLVTPTAMDASGKPIKR